MEVGREIRRLREEKGWSQAKLAGAAGMGVSGVSQIETGARNPSAVTLTKIAEALSVEVAEFFPKETRRSSLEPSFNDALADERRLGYLHAWRAFVYKLLHRWEQDPPKTAAEAGVVVDAMQALLDEGAFQRPPETITTSDSREASEWLDLSFLFRGIDRLNQIADTVQADAEAERRRAAFREIKGRMAG